MPIQFNPPDYNEDWAMDLMSDFDDESELYEDEPIAEDLPESAANVQNIPDNQENNTAPVLDAVSPISSCTHCGATHRPLAEYPGLTGLYCRVCIQGSFDRCRNGHYYNYYNYSICPVCPNPNICTVCRRYNGYIRNGVDHRICNYCLNDRYFRCEGCGSYVRNGEDCNECPPPPEGLIHPIDCYCRECQQGRRRTSSAQLIHNYNFKPVPEFKGNGPTYLGMELELAVPGKTLFEAATTAYRDLGSLAYLKYDGSVPGFELVTHPMSYEYAMGLDWEFLTRLSELGAEATSDCGLHIHVNRDGFKDMCHGYRWLKFIYRNADYVQNIARRYDSTYASFGSDDLNENPMRKFAAHWAKGENRYIRDRIWRPAHRERNYWNGSYETIPAGWEVIDFHPERYSAVNVQNENTFEVRAFASSTNQNEVKAALGLVDASVQYTRNLSASDVLRNDGWSARAFQKWLKSNKERETYYSAIVDETDKALNN